MKSEQEIRNEIAILRKAIEDEGFKPVPDGTRLAEHTFHQRMGAILFLEWALAEEQYEYIPEPEDPFLGQGE